MSLIPAKRYCDMCRGTVRLSPLFGLTYHTEGSSVQDLDYCSTVCLIRAAMSFTPTSERSPEWEAYSHSIKADGAP